ncbi:hypothetical protein HPG69_002053, partial [Diceros bicornis minor]
MKEITKKSCEDGFESFLHKGDPKKQLHRWKSKQLCKEALGVILSFLRKWFVKTVKNTLRIILGNVFILFLVIFYSHLHSPMYFKLAELLFIDVGLSSTTVPKMIADFPKEYEVISFQGCMTQTCLDKIMEGVEMVLLIAVAFERYMAIRKPLHYLNIRNSKICKCSSGDLSKAFFSLSAPITVVVLFLTPCMFVCVWPFPTSTIDKYLIIVDFAITPVLNPAIYTLKNKDK